VVIVKHDGHHILLITVDVPETHVLAVVVLILALGRWQDDSLGFDDNLQGLVLEEQFWSHELLQERKCSRQDRRGDRVNQSGLGVGSFST